MMFTKQHRKATLPLAVLTLCVLLLAAYAMLVNAPPSQAIDPDAAKHIPHLFETDMAECCVLAPAWDEKAAELRPLSFAERRRDLDEMFTFDHERDSGFEGFQRLRDQYIRAMNRRGVYFENEHELLSKQEREKRIKTIKECLETDPNSLVNPEHKRPSPHPSIETFTTYVQCMNEVVSLLSPMYRQKLDEIQARFDPLSTGDLARLTDMEMSEHFTAEEIAGINDELQAIFDEVGVRDEDFMEDPAADLVTWILFKNILTGMAEKLRPFLLPQENVR